MLSHAIKNQRKTLSLHQQAFNTTASIPLVRKDTIWKRSYTSQEWREMEPRLIGAFNEDGLFDTFVNPANADLVETFDRYGRVTSTKLREAKCPWEIKDPRTEAFVLINKRLDMLRDNYMEDTVQLQQNIYNMNELNRQMRKLDRRFNKQEEKERASFLEKLDMVEKDNRVLQTKIEKWTADRSKCIATFIRTMEMDHVRLDQVVKFQEFRNVWSYYQKTYGGETHGVEERLLQCQQGLATFVYDVDSTVEINIDYIEDNCNFIESTQGNVVSDSMKVTYLLNGICNSNAHYELKQFASQTRNARLMSTNASWDDVKTSIISKVNQLATQRKLVVQNPRRNAEHSNVATTSNNKKKRKQEQCNTAESKSSKTPRNDIWCDFCKKNTNHDIDNCFQAKDCIHCGKGRHNWHRCEENPRFKKQEGGTTTGKPSERFAKYHNLKKNK